EARPYPDARALEDARQSAPLALRARAVARVPLGLDVARARRRELDAVRPRRHRRAPASAARHRHHSPSRRYLPAHPYPQSCARFHAGIHADTFRLFISRRHMLEWMSFARSNYDRRSDLKGLALQLAGSLAFAGITAAIVLAAEPSNAPFASAFLVLWALSPLIARWASAPRDVETHREIDADERKGLRLIARRTWRFFEAFVTAEGNHLPPDNFQEDPRPVVAHRTSPTNIGLYLISVLSARDFGWIGTAEVLDRIEATLATMERLERYRGHFLNWYETQTLQSLEPRYVSSVDSGNLAGNLIILKNAMNEIAEAPPWDGERFKGIGDALSLLRQACEEAPQPKPPQIETILATIAALEHSLQQHPADSLDFARWLEGAASRLADIERLATRSGGEIAAWSKALSATAQSHARDIEPIAGLQDRLAAIAGKAEQLVAAMDFRFLLEQDR